MILDFFFPMRFLTTARDILEAKEEVTPLDQDLVKSVRKSVLIVAEPGEIEAATALAESPLNVPVFMGWHRNALLRLGIPLASESPGRIPKVLHEGPIERVFGRLDHERRCGMGKLAISNGREGRPS